MIPLRLLALSLLLGILQTPAGVATIQGTVIDSATADPVAGVLVTARMPSQVQNAAPPPVPTTQDSFGRTVMQVMTGADGRFSIRVPAGRAEIVFGKDLYGVRTLAYTTTAGQQLNDAVIRLARTGVVVGRVIDAANKPVPSATVTPIAYRLTNRGREVAHYPGVRTNDRGEFRLANLPSNAYLIAVSSPGSSVLYPGVSELSRAEHVQVESGSETRLRDVVLSGSIKAGKVKVRLVNGPDSAKDVQYSFTNATPSILAPGLDGNSLLEVQGLSFREPAIHLEPSQTWTSAHALSGIGRYRATVRWQDSRGYAVTYSVFTESTGDDSELTLLLTPPAGRLACRAFMEEDDGTLRPVAGLNIMIKGPQSSSCRTAGDGTALSSPVPAGRYSLQAFQGIPVDSYVADAPRSDFEVGTNSEQIEIRIRRGAARLQGTVTDNLGRKVHDAVVGAIPEDDIARALSDTGYPSARTDQNGTFEIRGLRPGRYRLYAWALIDDSAMQNPEFLKKWEGRAVELEIEERAIVSRNLTVLE